MREAKDDGWDRLHQHTQICYTCRRIVKRSRKSKQPRESQLQQIHAESLTHKIHKVTRGQKPLGSRASCIKTERCTIHHTMDILSHIVEQMLII